MKYIIFWVLSEMVPTSCPDAGKLDQFGRGVNSGFSCAVLHMREERTDLKRVFYNRDSAKTFYKEAIIESKKKNIFEHSDIQAVRIDSLKLNP